MDLYGFTYSVFDYSDLNMKVTGIETIKVSIEERNDENEESL